MGIQHLDFAYCFYDIFFSVENTNLDIASIFSIFLTAATFVGLIHFNLLIVNHSMKNGIDFTRNEEIEENSESSYEPKYNIRSQAYRSIQQYIPYTPYNVEGGMTTSTIFRMYISSKPPH